jgi:general nucleoside transport system permease protein
MRIIKRANITAQEKLKHLLMAIGLAFTTVSLFVWLLGFNPITIYPIMLTGIFGTSYRMISMLKYITPLLMVSLGISIAFKMKFWNIGGEGQLIMGAIFATFFALYANTLPRLILLIIMALAAMIGGGLYGWLAAFIKVKFNTNETIVTLMLNYIAMQLLIFLQYVSWKEGNFPLIPQFKVNATLPAYQGLSLAIVIALLTAFVVDTLLTKTKWGFELTVLGESRKTAKYIGIHRTRLTLMMMFLSGAIIGLAGFTQVAGTLQTLSTGVTMGVGFTGVVIAWVSKLNVKRMLVVSLLFAALIQTTSFLETAISFPAASVDVIQALVLFFVIGSEFFNEYQIVKGDN